MCGRADEYAMLSKLFHTKVNQQSHAEYVMIKGSSGIGKSALAYELCKDVAKQNGFYLNGKFDKYDQQPYSAYINVA